MRFKDIPWAVVIFIVAQAMIGIWWASGINEKVAAAERGDIRVENWLLRVERKIDKIYTLWFGHSPPDDDG